MFFGYSDLRPHCRQLYNGYKPVVFSQCNRVRDVTFGVVAISMSCYCFIVLSLSLFIVDK